jgi:hypothetical protein
MRTLPHWGHLLPLLGATFAYYFGLGWLKLARLEANRGECAYYPKHTYAELPTDDYGDEDGDGFPGDFCPVHNHEFHGDLGQECPGCREEWEQVWVPTEEDDQRRDDFSDQAEERAQSDAWYQDLIARSEGRDPHHPWRD